MTQTHETGNSKGVDLTPLAAVGDRVTKHPGNGSENLNQV